MSPLMVFDPTVRSKPVNNQAMRKVSVKFQFLGFCRPSYGHADGGFWVKTSGRNVLKLYCTLIRSSRKRK
jgi:hypothetical protein